MAPLRRSSRLLDACGGRKISAGIQSQFARRLWWQIQWGRCEYWAPRQEYSTLLLNGTGLRWLFATLLLQHPSKPPQMCDAWCQLFAKWLSVLPNIPPKKIGSEQKGRVLLLWLIFSTCLAYLLLRLKTANTAFVVLSFNFHVWWYSPTVAMSLLCTPLFVSLHQHAWLLGDGVCILFGEVVAGQRCRCWGEGVPRLIIEGRRSWGVVTCSVAVAGGKGEDAITNQLHDQADYALVR